MSTDKTPFIFARLIPVIVVVVIGYLAYDYYQDHQRDKAYEQREAVRNDEIMEFITKYNALTEWGDQEYFTSDLEDLLVNSDKPVAFSAILEDIERQDGRYLLRFTSGYDDIGDSFNYLDYLLTLDCDSQQTSQIKQGIEPDDYNSMIVLAEVTEVSKPKLAIRDSIVSEYGDDFVMFEYSQPETFLINGFCVDALKIDQ